MKRLLPLLIALLIPTLVHAQYSRWDYAATTTSGQGQLIPVLAIPYAPISFYSCTGTASSTCTVPLVTYQSATGGACPTNAQVVLQQQNSCGSISDAQGNFGAWLPSSSTYGYGYTITINGAINGPFQFTVGGGGGGSGVPSVNGSADPVVINGPGVNCTITSGTQTCAVAAAGVTSLNSLTGALALVCTPPIVCTPAGSTITISLGSAFAITSFIGGATVELGTSVVNPPFAATYSVTPTSANITNTENIGSPLTLATPFTSGTVTGTFVHTAIETTTFTLSATQGSTLTATQTINWEPAIFGGVGTAGATSSVTASGTTAVLSNGNVLPRTQIGAETVGETFGPFSPSGQVIYLLLTGGSHTFIDAGTGFPFAFNAPLPVSFVNANGVSLTMYLYQTTNSLYETYTPKVAS